MSFTCPECGRTSHHPEDEKQGYCGACHKFVTPERIAESFFRAADILEREGLTAPAMKLREEGERWKARAVRYPFNPDWVIRPGLTLVEWCDTTNTSYRDLWRACGLEADDIFGIIDGHVEITDDIAAKLAQGTGIVATFWRNLERNYREGLAAGKEDVS